MSAPDAFAVNTTGPDGRPIDIDDVIGEWEEAISQLSGCAGSSATDRLAMMDAAAQHARDGLNYLPALVAAAKKEEEKEEAEAEAEGGGE